MGRGVVLQCTLVDLTLSLHRVKREHDAAGSFADETAQRFAPDKSPAEVIFRAVEEASRPTRSN